MKILFKIYTPYGDCFSVNEIGDITKNGNPFSGHWKILGIESVKSNYFIPFCDINKNSMEGFGWTYKNGNPRYTVRDLDHGSTRTWGNTKYHGIKSISFQN